MGCDKAGHVISLDLSGESITGGVDNSSELFSLKYLQRLNLASNMLFDSEAEVPSRIGNLTNLKYLNLSSSGFTGQIPIEISSLTRLVTLDFSSAYLDGLRIVNPDLKAIVQNFTDMKELYLDGMNMYTNGSEWGQALSSSLPNLQVLSLIECFLSGPIHSSLLKLRSLSAIYLDNNDLSTPVPQFFPDFPNLKILSLSNCNLSGKLPENIFKIPTLDSLWLDNSPLLYGSVSDFPLNNSFQTLIIPKTNLSGTLPDSIGNLKSLSKLDLQGCNFMGPLPTSMAKLAQLVHLDLSSNHFSGPIPEFHMLRSLAYLDLHGNALVGGISYVNLEMLPYLTYLDISSNVLNGSVHPLLFQPSGTSAASSSVLETLDLSHNRFEGHVPESIFELRKLTFLDLSANKFNGSVHLDMIGRLGNLTNFDISHNNFAVSVSSNFSSFPPKIEGLGLASCNLSEIPNIKNNQWLARLDLSNNQFSGDIPKWIWQAVITQLNLSNNNFVGLEKPYLHSKPSIIDLHSNQLQGNIPLQLLSGTYIDYSNNHLNFSLPNSIGHALDDERSLFFSVSNNNLTGVIPNSMCSARDLQVLDLSSNNLSGEIPSCLVEAGEELGVLNLKNNRFSGFLPDTFPSNCGLQTLSLNGNQLQGKVPKSLANCKSLEVLDLGNNNFTDGFPCWLKNTSSLHVLVLRSNHFGGKISCIEHDVSWPAVQIVDLAFNNFTGKLPRKGFTFWEAMMEEGKSQSDLQHLHFTSSFFSRQLYNDAIVVNMKGVEIELVKILTIFTSIDLSSNDFEGQIPDEIGLLKSLHFLNLSRNALTGPIPSSIGKLEQLESLDLSINNLQGHIPSQLASLNFLSVLNLSHNHLVGSIPTGTQIQSFSSSSFQGNKALCGLPLKTCSNTTLQIPDSNNKGEPDSFKFGWQLALFIGVGFGTGFVAAVAPLIFSDKVNLWYDKLAYKLLGHFCRRNRIL